MIEFFTEYRVYLSAVLLLSCGAKLAVSTACEIRFAGLFLTIVGAISLPVTSATFALGAAVTLSFIFLAM